MIAGDDPQSVQYTTLHANTEKQTYNKNNNNNKKLKTKNHKLQSAFKKYFWKSSE